MVNPQTMKLLQLTSQKGAFKLFAKLVGFPLSSFTGGYLPSSSAVLCHLQSTRAQELIYCVSQEGGGEVTSITDIP